jgi:ribonucleotide reductase beta subunit family protein with ferritin-like domain
MIITSPDLYFVTNGEVSIGTLSADVSDVTWSISGSEIQIVDSVMSFIEATDSTVKNVYNEMLTATKDAEIVHLNITINIV